MLLRMAITLAVALWLIPGGGARAQGQEAGAAVQDRMAITGGAQTLDDILRRQRGEKVDLSFRRKALGNPEAAAPITAPLGTLGGVSDPELWRAYRYGLADLTTQIRGPAATVVIQDGGMRWLQWRRDLLPGVGGWMLVGMIALLAAFYLLRGRIRVEGGLSGEKVLRFHLIERIAHWSMAGSFILLGITGLVLLYGRPFLIPLLGKETFSAIATGGKYIHNFISFLFMAGLLASFLLWAVRNLPERADIVWLLKGGGLFVRGVHPPAGKFNAGEKIMFWLVILFGLAVSLTGISLLLPFRIELAGPVFALLNDLGLPQVLGLSDLPASLSPQEEMQYAQIVHAGIAFVFMTVILAHVYLGTIGMEGALESMTRGTVDVQWAKEHHDLWYEEIRDRERSRSQDATPAE